ncbi:hypothetical protein [Aeromonas dhakensis]|uniref:hypothetical protein n=1 Tax=Aeromonas dhakensis TaxID=196024 RepID=UPI003570ACDD
MADKNTWRTVCLDAGDESGDVIIELPGELLDSLGWSVGDQLVVEKSDDLILLKLKQMAPWTIQTEPWFFGHSALTQTRTQWRRGPRKSHIQGE